MDTSKVKISYLGTPEETKILILPFIQPLIQIMSEPMLSEENYKLLDGKKPSEWVIRLFKNSDQNYKLEEGKYLFAPGTGDTSNTIYFKNGGIIFGFYVVEYEKLGANFSNIPHTDKGWPVVLDLGNSKGILAYITLG
jgi:hypothetical protein